MLEIKFSNVGFEESSDTFCIIFGEQSNLHADILSIDKACHSLITQVLQNKDFFEPKFGNIKSLTVSHNNTIRHVVLVGIGEEKKITQYNLEEIGGKIVACVHALQSKSAVVMIHTAINAMSAHNVAASIAYGATLGAYDFEKYHTDKKKYPQKKLTKIEMSLSEHAQANKIFAEYRHVIRGVLFARELVNEPPNILNPDTYVEKIITAFDNIDVNINVINEEEMKNLGMGAIVGVGQGSTCESKMVTLQYLGADNDDKPLVFVGKGVTFDTGGISLKPSLNMHEMKYDMAGSAAVVGLIMALALRKAKVNAVGVIGLVENMPDGNAQRPGDVVTTMSGKTVEVLNTDAEGRLVLADAVWYAQETFKPKVVIDLATLTGAIIVALGSTYAGCFSNNDDLANKITNSGDKVGEKIWRMPLHKDYEMAIKSDVADIANIGPGGTAGSAMGAHFIQYFIQENVEWAHLDIAGVAWEKKGCGVTPKGSTGFGVRLLNSMIQNYYEN